MGGAPHAHTDPRSRHGRGARCDHGLGVEEESPLPLNPLARGCDLPKLRAYGAHSRAVVSLLLAGSVALTAGATCVRAQSGSDSTALADGLADALARDDSPL